MNRSETGQLLQLMTDRWPAWRLPAGQHLMSLVTTWAGDLTHVPPGAAAEAVRAASLDGREWPPPLGWVVVEGLRRSGVPMPPDPDEAWLEVQDAASHVGRYGSPTWSHPALAGAVKALGGFISLCDSQDAMADRAHFMKLYPLARQRAVVEVCSYPERFAVGMGETEEVEVVASQGGLPAGPGLSLLRTAAPKEEACAAVIATKEAFRSAPPHPNHKRARTPQ